MSIINIYKINKKNEEQLIQTLTEKIKYWTIS